MAGHISVFSSPQRLFPYGWMAGVPPKKVDRPRLVYACSACCWDQRLDLRKTCWIVVVNWKQSGV